tara:strand:+ start:137973 stop:138989 length:1017 start_codon:yes stop_codon:yes gene_type:complete
VKTVILCGGSGTRLWPVSRKKSPKQFAKIFNGESLFEKTVKRNQSLAQEFVIVVNQAQLDLCKSQINSKATFLAESIGRNTAPAIALAALFSDPEDILLVLPSDHLIKDMDIYKSCVEQAQAFAKEDKLVTFGIKAAHPETGYGYIEADGNEVLSFKEKPNKELAQKYVESGKYFWNSGMFCFKARVFLEELQKHAPEMHAACLEAKNQLDQGSEITLTQEVMSKIPAQSIDYAVMEKSDKVKVVPSHFHWSDLGSFDSLYHEFEKDESGNATDANLVQIESENNLVLSNKKVVATFNVKDLIIIDTEDALLIGKRGETQKVKELMTKVVKERPELAE